MNPLFYGKDGVVINYYRMFKIKPGCKPEAIRSRFCELIKKFHPDTAGEVTSSQSEIISVIVNGYRVLSDAKLKKEYDSLLINDKLKNHDFIIPSARIKYNLSLSKVIKSRTDDKKIRHTDLVKKFGHDVEILINRAESINGSKAYIELPSKTICPVCAGMDSSCYMCEGLGRITSISILEVNIPRGVHSGEIYNFDLTSMKPDSSTNFTLRTISVKITIQVI